ncbi:MAG: Glu/Leu/Phe/Val dehydrogenase dimerization domain-containing protein [Chlamydiales bacterium]
MGKTVASLTFQEHHVEGYERVVEISDEQSGLHAIVAIHDTRLGPALGGIRVYPYATFEQALNDVLRLSKGMTYKAAITETGTGGGKSVIIADYKKPKAKELLLAFAEAVNHFEGHYICAEDVGMPISDLAVVGRKTRFAVGLPDPKSSGDPSPFTAFGGFRGIQAVCKKLWGQDSVQGKRIAIQGLGSVGRKLAEHLFWHGAHLIVTDIEPGAMARAVKDFGAEAVAPEKILSVECDILAPCALGAIINSNTIPHLRCQAVAGLANNQLAHPSDGEALLKRGILYAPDFVINAGGLLNVCVECEEKGYNSFVARQHVERIYGLLLTIFALADEKKASTSQIANEIAEYNLDHGVGKRTTELVFHHESLEETPA